jgi:hypothetical protein
MYIARLALGTESCGQIWISITPENVLPHIFQFASIATKNEAAFSY